MNSQDTPEQRLRRHQEAVEWFFRLQGEGQSTAQTEQWIDWCSADPANQQAFEHLLPLWQARWAVPEQRPQSIASVSSGTDRIARRRGRLPSRRWALLAAAAGIAVVVVGVLNFPRPGGVLRLGAMAQMSSVIGQSRSAQLIDGSRVALGARSRIDVKFSASRREIELQDGEAFLNVAHDRSRQFIVHAGNLEVVAVGTAFDVNRRGGRVIVTVQEGVVEVSAGGAGAIGAAPPMRVSRGGQLNFDQSDVGPPTLRIVNPESADAWRRGRFEYVAEPLAAVIEDLNRYSKEQITVQDAGLGALRYSGTIEVTAIAEWLRALPNIFAVRVQFSPDHHITLSAPETAAN